MTTPRWRTSSRSMTSGGECVEVAVVERDALVTIAG
ncbi:MULTISPECIES: DUF397 domain-containing protein [Actinoallomurus]